MIIKLLRFLNKIKKFPFFVITPLPYAFGNASEHVLLAANKAKEEKKKLLIIYTNFASKFLNYKVCNKSLFNDLIINKTENTFKIEILRSFLRFFLEIEFFILRFLVVLNDSTIKLKIDENSRFLTIGIPEIYENDKIKAHALKNSKFKSIPKFNLSYNLIDLKARINQDCKLSLEKFGLSKNQKFVCLHVRDFHYRKDKGRKNYRNSNINNYIDCIKYLIKKNFYVFRIGDPPTNKIRFKNTKFIDYPASEIKSAYMDLYLIKKCEFYIGTQSGPMDTAYLFNKPVLSTNMNDLFSSIYPRKKVDRGIFKKIYNKKKKLINVSEFISMPYMFHNPEIKIDDFTFEENSPKDLYESVKEFYNHLVESEKISKIQEKFDLILKSRFERFFYETENKKNLLNHVEALKMIRVYKANKGYLLNYYLNKNFK